MKVLDAHAQTVKTQLAKCFEMLPRGDSRIDFDADFAVGGELEVLARETEQIFDLFRRQVSRCAAAPMKLDDRAIFGNAAADAFRFTLEDIKIRRRPDLFIMDDDVAGEKEAEAFTERNVHVKRYGRFGTLGRFMHSFEIGGPEIVVPHRGGGIARIAWPRAIVPRKKFLADAELVARLLKAGACERHGDGLLPHRCSGPGIKHHSALARVDKQLGIFNGRLLQDSVAQIEDVASSPERADGGERHVANFLRRAEQYGRVDVSLQYDSWAEHLSNLSQVNAPVDTEDSCARTRHGREQMLRGPGVVDDRNGATNRQDDLLHSGKREIFVVLRVQLAAPGIEQLDGRRARGDLGLQIGNRCLSDAMEQRAKGFWLVVQKALYGGETLFGLAFNHVTGK